MAMQEGAKRRGLIAVLDWAEKAALTGLFVALLVQMIPDLGRAPLRAVFLAPNALVAGLVLTRRRTRAVSLNPLDWLIALGASTAPLLLATSTAKAVGYPWVAEGVMLAGMAISLMATLALWRSYGVVPANRGVKRTGPYRVVRHPMYAGYALWQLGFVLSHPGWANGLCFLAALGLQLWRIDREEQFLKIDPDYASYMLSVRYRLAGPVY
jgi:protein-S-isoprenylcysteine O-methyltransferase Ste14